MPILWRAGLHKSFGKPAPIPILGPPAPDSRPARPAQYDTGLGTYFMCGAAVFFGCWLGCCLIPFCTPQMKDAVHHCPHCTRVVGMKTLINTSGGAQHNGTARAATATV